MKIYTDKELKNFYATSYEVVDFKFEYPQYNEAVGFGIITDMTEPELESKYGDDLNRYRPYIILNSDFGIERYKYQRNEKKFQMRIARKHDFYNFEDGEIELYHAELVTDDLEKQFVKSEEEQALQNAIRRLKPIQKERLIKYYYEEKTLRQIADEEGVSHQVILKSISAALENLKKFLN